MSENEQADVPSTSRLKFGQKVKHEAGVAEAVETNDFGDTEVETEVEAEVENAPEVAETAQETVEDVSEPDVPEVVVSVADEAPEADDEPFEVPEIEAPAEDPEARSVEDLAAERDRLDAEIKERQDAEKAAVIAQIKTVVGTYNISTEELVEALGGLKSKRKGVRAKIKYKDPVSGALWSGRGKTPAWAKGKNLEDFLLPEDQQVRPE